jgi:predicted transcriptional regulator
MAARLQIARTVRIDLNLYQALVQLADDTGISQNRLMNLALAEFLKDQKIKAAE